MKKHIHHIHIILLAGALTIFGLLLLTNILAERIILKQKITFGVSFSPRYASELGLDPQKTYLSILSELGTKRLRLNAYWDDIEPFDSEPLDFTRGKLRRTTQGKPFHFDDLDWYINQATKNQAQVILAVGFKLPRWPECRAPKWLDLSNLSYLRERQLKMVEAVIRRYEQNPTISAWQLENEPLLRFGICPPPDKKFLEQEVALVRSLSKKPIILTDSGELSSWKTSMQLSDILGTTLYRTAEDKNWGTFYYPLRPWFYRAKSTVVRKFFAPTNKKTIIAELQTEIWAGEPIMNIPIETQIKRFSLDQLKNTIDYTRRTGFDEAYLWGAEWWYYLAKNGHPEYLEYAKTLFDPI